MSDITYQNHNLASEVDELSRILDNLVERRKKAKKLLGDVGLFFSAPYNLILGAIQLRKNRRHLYRFHQKMISDFHHMDPRDQMEIELGLIDLCDELDRKLNPILKRIEATNYIGRRLFIVQAKAIQRLFHSASATVTSLVYPKKQNPSNNPVLFKKLVKAYEGIDLSDWKSESDSVYDKPFNKHAEV